MKRIAILTGGLSAEVNVSLKSAEVIAKYLDAAKYETYTIVITNDRWYWQEDESVLVDKNDFTIQIAREKVSFDAVFAAIHGVPLEDGKLQGYFDLLGLPYTCSNGFVSGLTFDKSATKEYLKSECATGRKDFPRLAQSILLKGGVTSHPSLAFLPFPLFVKPNKNGSSYGVTKVLELEGLEEAILKSFQFDDEVLVEEFVQGREFTCGVMQTKEELIVFSPTEIIPENDFFDYEAKYQGKSKEVTPAVLSVEQTKEMQDITKALYQFLGCKGMARIDYILQDDVFYLLEVNTIPGLSEQSVIPQQARFFGWNLSVLFDKALQNILYT